MDLRITPRAIDKIRESAAKEGVDLTTTMLRIAVIPGGCSGLTYDLGWDTTVRSSDESDEVANLTVVLDRKSLVYVDGSELDYTGGLEGAGFHFNNPNAVRTCACGESFGL